MTSRTSTSTSTNTNKGLAKEKQAVQVLRGELQHLPSARKVYTAKASGGSVYFKSTAADALSMKQEELNDKVAEMHELRSKYPQLFTEGQPQ
ncbi:hypothetical protein PTSG_11577 [Salpingoeca rosetta]|uniref:Prefoldin subunit 1 n=1 Tax=Salpingoeca rosetta (strain ATCC 50818 / BSB-021) TaxID=946362 RepID=F2TW50_SALR5|nr:uncharacterized protein PTSG_11577 [Salpingoeca rosetta]EGD72296.1 hypothetical protein PTSG_11577 [Salpingoeca rosetta]|eukprot:XP_004998866.1 hypothetical protein PTSG_11577 [Salpingoeca rosetta]